MQGQFITVRFISFKGRRNCWTAFTEMGKSRRQIWNSTGLIFSKHLGSGAGNGFSIIPDLNVYAWLGVWADKESADNFFLNDIRWKQFTESADRLFGWDGIPMTGHGTWNKLQPFLFADRTGQWNGPVAVITRASIRWTKSLLFWMNVPSAGRNINSHDGLLFAKGVGELPLVEQATFSIWKSFEHLQQFAYRSREHAPMVRKTRKYNWYSEEMFVRIGVTEIIGTIPPLS